ncbi:MULTISPECIES: uracil-DNA glycosylase [unclassified Tenacibaculum]|uniref:uracil-DNA glycosylase n=1 Tax=unclassified Tenacibaculum TaxID=2635139 RepID=UPI001F28B6A8|nr:MULTISPECIES: uracil-DNA glycosylase [unclassified Tenacibaculum]MCF2873970.1 uracil-DNA glycosylase [Tenacibaculum sp. Cn5-1]MCF2934551.1 uracil-DNA glycosylase [Tenacibaculum sp. Cn5-34]MCG7510761.1 uracil-DNA glycosylase [Tenacibaculum sp. Cn5-46]
MQVKIADSWKNILQSEFEKDYFKNLTSFVKNEYSTRVCYPKGSEVFAAFDACSLDDLKVVILGQDPYHGKGQANGLCFSVHDQIQHPPSLINIFKEIETDLRIPYPKSGDLSRWAKQGVLLLNATLTVRESEAGSHQKQGWEEFTDAVIRKVSDEKKDVVFLLWGGFAKKKVKLIDTKKHHVLTSGHPSPLSANRGYWFGNKHFSKTNDILKDLNLVTIQW